jgi:SulP family sulfate permease
MPLTRPTDKTLLERYLPIADWLPGYDWRTQTRWDLVAGLTVWALLVPEAMAYASIAGVPPEAGLYTAPLALIGYAVFGSSRHLFVGPSSTVAILSAATVGGVVASGSASFWDATAWLAVITGVLLLTLGIIRMGWIGNFMSQPVLDGFIVGLAITIAVGQLDKMFGIEAAGENVVREFLDVPAQFDGWHAGTITVGLASLALLFLMHRFTPKIPAALTVVILAIAFSAVFGFEESGVDIVGDVPAGLPPIGLPAWPEAALLTELAAGALAVVVVGYTESLAAAQQYAKRHGYEIDPNQELIGLGLANLGAGISRGFVVDGSLSKTAAGESAGQETQMTGLIAAGITVITILFLTGLFFNLPEATLGAIVVHAVWKLINFEGLRRMFRIRRLDFYAGAGAFLGVLLLGILSGVVIGVVISLAALLYLASFPSSSELGKISVSGRDIYVPLDDAEDAERIPGVVVHRLNASLIFSNASGFTRSVKEMLYRSDPPADIIVLDCERMAQIDLTGAEALRGLVMDLRANGVETHLARIQGGPLEISKSVGVVDELGDGSVHPTVAEAVKVALENESRT